MIGYFGYSADEPVGSDGSSADTPITDAFSGTDRAIDSCECDSSPIYTMGTCTGTGAIEYFEC